MSAFNVCVVVIALWLGWPHIVTAQAATYIGEVIIVGNKYTPDRYIRQHLDLYPGQVLRYPELRVAERNLAKLDWFLFDAKKGIRPTVQVLDNPGPYKDVLVKVQERPGNWARLAAWEVVLSRSTMNYSRLLDAAELVRIGITEMMAPPDDPIPGPPAPVK